MSNLTETSLNTDRHITEQISENETSHFRRRILSDRRCSCPRRYVMAFLLSVLLVIEVVRNWNLNFSIVYTILSDESEKKTHYPSIGDWSLTELDAFARIVILGAVVMNIMGGLMIYKFSSYNFLLVSVTASSILHALMPTALSHHSTAFLLFVMLGQEAFSAPIFIAVLSMWKDWAPPDERTSLVTISFFGIVLGAINPIISYTLLPYGFKSISYIVGIAGIIWALFWYNISSSTPQSDPLMTEKEYFYLESKIPSNYQEKTNLRNVPWKCLLKSTQITVLSLIFFKLGISLEAIQVHGMLYLVFMSNMNNPLVILIPFMVLLIFFFFVSSFLMDFLLKRYRDRAVMIRKIFLSSGLVLQSVFLFGSIASPSSIITAVLFAVANCCFALSIPGTLRFPLDVSPRYVPIIASFAFGFYYLGKLSFQEYSHQTFDPHSPQPLSSVAIYDSIISLVVAVVFSVWGDTEEQSWSYITSSQRRGNDYRSYPQPDDEDDINLVPGTV